MVSIASLWLSIALASVLVFVTSSVIHMFLGWHRNDFRRLPDEDGAMGALRPLDIPPGDYVMPFAASQDERSSDAFQARVAAGPAAFFTVLPAGQMSNMGSQLTQWFAYSVGVGIVVAYLGGRMLGPGAEYLDIFRLTGTVAFACYAMSLPQRSIWYAQGWGSTLRSMVDGLVYALLTAGAFAGFWPG